MSEADKPTRLPPPLIAVAGWLLPGAGYWLIGQRARAGVVASTIVAVWVLGLLIAGVRVIDVPGYDNDGNQIRLLRGARLDPHGDSRYASGGWALTSGGFLSEIADKPWFVGQILAGPLCLASAGASISAARGGIDRPHAPLDAIGTLYTAVAGMLNLLVIIDSTYRAGQS